MNDSSIDISHYHVQLSTYLEDQQLHIMAIPVAMSSPLSSQGSDILPSPILSNEICVAPPEYRSSILLPFELREHCRIYLEETLCMSRLYGCSDVF